MQSGGAGHSLREPGRARQALPLIVALSLVLAAPAAAHRLAPSLLSIEEQPGGELQVRFKTPLQRPAGVDVAPELPARCTPREAPRFERDATSATLRWTAVCGAGSLVGERIAVRGLEESATNALLRIRLADGRQLAAVLHGGAPEYRVPQRASAFDVFRDYLRLGVGHILSGFDHLLFVFGLLLLVRGAWPLLATVTAFTFGHSVTLSLATLGLVRFPTALIEWVIAVTLLVLALELAREPVKDDAWLRRRPWAVAFGFGLLHGFGFAGALAEVGLPGEEIPLALFSFNVGIELGQLAFVAVVLAVRAAAGPAFSRAPAWLQRAPVTAMGALAFYWCLDRGAGLF